MTPVRFGRGFLLGRIMVDSVFVGFRREARNKYIALLGLGDQDKADWYREDTFVLKAKYVLEHGHDYNTYVRTFKLLNWSLKELKNYLLRCEEKGTKFICLDEGFSFDGSVPANERKRSRNYTVMKCKIPETGNSFVEMMKNCREEPPPKTDEDIWFGKWREVINDYFKASPADPSRHLYTMEQIAHLHGFSVTSLRRLISKSMEELDIDLKRLKQEKLLRKAQSEFKRKREVVIMQEKSFLETRKDSLHTWMKLVYARLQAIEDEVTLNIEEDKGVKNSVFRLRKEERHQSIVKTREKIERIKNKVEQYNEIMAYAYRRLNKIPDFIPDIK